MNLEGGSVPDWVAAIVAVLSIGLGGLTLMFRSIDQDMKRLEHHMEELLKRLDNDLRRIEHRIEEREAAESAKRATLYERLNRMFERIHKIEVKIAKHFGDDGE